MSKWCNSAGVAVRRRRENLSRTSGSCLAWIVHVRRRKSGRAGDPCHGPWALVDPRDNAVDIDRGGDCDVLHVGLRHAPIPGPTQPKGAHPLCERPFDAGALRILRLALRTGIPGPGVGYGRRLSARRKPQPAAPVCGTGARGADRARRTRLGGTLHNDRATALAPSMLPPRRRQVPLGTAHLVVVPVDHKLLGAVRALDLGLPALARTGGTAQDDVLLVAAGDQERCADIRRVDEGLAWRHVLLDERLLDGLRALRLMDRGGRRVHVCEQMGGVGSHVSLTWTRYPVHCVS